MKKCCTCKVEKALESFPPRKSAKDGHRSTCRECTTLWHANYYKQNITTINQRQLEYTESNAEQNNERAKLWGRQNRAATSLRLKEWRLANPEENKVLRRRHRQTRRAKLNAGGEVDVQRLAQIASVSACSYCGVNFDTGSRARTLDHVLPIARGGTNHSSNVCAACSWCNKSKGQKILFYEWLPPGLARERTYTKEEVEVYVVEEIVRQRAALDAEQAQRAAA